MFTLLITTPILNELLCWSRHLLSPNITAGLATLLTLILLSLKHPSNFYDIKSHEKPQPLKRAIQALLYIINPTRSVWPPYYNAACQQAERSQTRTLKLSLNILIKDLVEGTVELRSPSADLRSIIKGKIGVGPWTIIISPSMSMWFQAMIRLVKEELLAGQEDGVSQAYIEGSTLKPLAKNTTMPLSVISCPKSMAQLLLGDDNLDSNKYLPNLQASSFSNIRFIVLPEFVSRHAADSFVGSLRISFMNDWRQLMLLEFTSCERSFDFVMGTGLVHYTRPFTSSSTHNGGRMPRLSPLFLSLRYFISLLTSGRDTLNVLALKNVSASFADVLDAHADQVYPGTATRTDVIGLKERRKAKLFAHWQAALFKEQMLCRWVILLSK